MDKEININFISKKELQIIKSKVSAFTKSKEIVISYGHTNSDTKQYDNVDQLNIKYLQNNEIFQYGGSIVLGKQDKWKLNDINSIELLGSFRIRLTELPSGKPLTIFNTIAILPYIGIDAGWDINELLSNSGNNNIYGVSRWLMGMSFIVHKQIEINLEFQQDFGSKDDDVLLLGAGFLL